MTYRLARRTGLKSSRYCKIERHQVVVLRVGKRFVSDLWQTRLAAGTMAAGYRESAG